MSSPSRNWFFSAITAAAVVFAVESESLRLSLGLPLALTGALVAFLFAWKRGALRRTLQSPVGARESIAFIGVVLLAVVVANLGRSGPSRLVIQGIDPFTLAHDGFALVVALFMVMIATGEGDAFNGPASTSVTRTFLASRSVLPLAMLLAFALGLTSHWLRVGLQPIGWIQDEAHYLFQASLFRLPGFGQPFDEALLPFVAIDHEYLREGLLRAQYPPGWPLMLAAFDALGALPVATSLSFALVVLGAHRFAAQVTTRENAGLAALLVATSPPLVLEAGKFFAHLITAALALATATLLLHGLQRTGRARALAWLGAGVLSGTAFAVRPLTAVALTAAIGIFVLLWSRPSMREVLQLLGLGALGAVVPVLLVLRFNAITTGEALRFGYTATNGALHALGFGLRGAVRWSSDGVRYLDAAEFTPVSAMVGFAQMWRLLFLDSLHGALAAAIAAVAIWSGGRPSAKVMAPLLLLPVAYFFYFYSHPRLVTELVPFVIIGTAAMTLWIVRSKPTLGVRLMWSALLLNLAGSAGALSQVQEIHRPMRAALAAVLQEAERGPVVALFNGDSTRTEDVLHGLVSLRATADSARVIGARDLGDRNSELLARYPTHRALRVVVVRDSLSRLEPIH